MLTNGVTTGVTLPALRGSEIAPGTGAQKVVIVNGSPEILELLETALDAGRYDIVFVESTEHAYSQIKRVQPNLVILCLQVDDMDGFQVLSMLKLDAETRNIPVVTCTVTSYSPARAGTFRHSAPADRVGAPAQWISLPRGSGRVGGRGRDA